MRIPRLALHLRDRARVARGISPQGFYAKALRPGDLAFDIGANLGQHTAAMLGAGARVIAVEPQANLARDLIRNLPAATVLELGVGAQPGQASLVTSSSHPELATLNSKWAAINRRGGTKWDDEQAIRLTTLDTLIDDYGVPSFVKIDTEGFEDEVLAGLSRPIEQLLFEVHSAMPDVAARAFERLAAIDSYEYLVMTHQSWMFRPVVDAESLLADLPGYGDVWARRIFAAPATA